MLEVTMVTTKRVVFQGDASHVIVPGEKGVFEICPFHKPIASRLFPGRVAIDRKVYRIKHGMVQVNKNKISMIVHLDKEGQ